MNIVVAVRCLNEEKNIARFMRGYDFADTIVVSDGGSKDNSVGLLQNYPKVKLIHFTGGETVEGEFWNTDAPHMNFVLDAAKALNPDWLIFDDMDCVPNKTLKQDAREIFEQVKSLNQVQINAFRLYMWGDDQYFPHMNRNFDMEYVSLWAWRPDAINIRADPEIRHGTMIGIDPNYSRLNTPYCLLHKSWHPDTIQQKVNRYNKIGLPMNHPIDHPESFGVPEPLPEWAVE
jgi:glycosyltransferase involved in cell wall biosynthesis